MIPSSKIVLAVICLFVMLSCQKEGRQNVTEAAPRDLVAEARQHFEEHVYIPPVTDPHARLNNPFLLIEKAPAWELSAIQPINNRPTVVTPVKLAKSLKVRNSNGAAADLSGSLYLLSYKNTAGAMQTELLTYIPDSHARAGNMSGILLVEDWKGGYRKGYKIKDGQSYLLADYRKNASKRDLENAYMEYVCEYTDWYWCESSGGDVWDCYLIFTSRECSYKENGGYPLPDSYKSVYEKFTPKPEYNVLYGLNINAASYPEMFQSLTPQINNSCLQVVFNKLAASGWKETVSVITRGMFVPSNNTTVSIASSSFEQVTVTQTVSGTNPTFHIAIEMNPVNYTGAAVEYTYAAMIYKIVWGYYHAKNRLDVFDYPNFMDFYVSKVSALLMAKFPGLPANHAKALAWYGAKERYAWKLVMQNTPALAGEYEQLLIDYKTREKGQTCVLAD